MKYTYWACIKNRFVPLFTVLMLFLGGGATAMAASDGPKDEIKQTVDEIINIMTDEKYSTPDMKEERRDLILEKVNNRFDFYEMSQRTLARRWRERTTEEKEQFVELFKQLLEKTYTSKIDSYSNEKVLFKKEVIRNDKALVYSFIQKNEKEIPIFYKLKNKSGKWMVYDVIIEGVSLVRNYRTEFTQIISKEDYSGLIKRMKEKIAQNKENATDKQ